MDMCFECIICVYYWLFKYLCILNIYSKMSLHFCDEYLATTAAENIALFCLYLRKFLYLLF